MAYVTIIAISAGKAKINRKANDVNFHLQQAHHWINDLVLGEKVGLSLIVGG